MYRIAPAAEEEQKLFPGITHVSVSKRVAITATPTTSRPQKHKAKPPFVCLLARSRLHTITNKPLILSGSPFQDTLQLSPGLRSEFSGAGGDLVLGRPQRASCAASSSLPATPHAHRSQRWLVRLFPLILSLERACRALLPHRTLCASQSHCVPNLSIARREANATSPLPAPLRA